MAKSNLVHKVSDFLRVESGRIDTASSIVVGGLAAASLLGTVLSGKAEARACCTDTCNNHGDIHSEGYGPYTDQAHSDGGYYTYTDGQTHYNDHSDCW